MYKCSSCGTALSKFGKTPSGSQRWRCRYCDTTTSTPDTIRAAESVDSEVTAARTASILADKAATRKFVVTSAQNNTPINHPFFKALLRYCEDNKAELLVIPVRYKNPTGWESDSATTAEYAYHTDLIPYLVDTQLILSDDIVIRGDIKIQATAADPVTGLETISGTRSAIFGHAQSRMKVVATPQDKLPKLVQTTGSVSVRNYSNTKAGAKGKHHHTMSAIILSVSKNSFSIRELAADSDGSFYDLDSKYSESGITRGHRAAALVTGDEHVMFNCNKVRLATYHSDDSIVSCFKPKLIVRHDVLDFYSQNHHHKNNRLTRFVKAITSHDNVKDELDLTIDFINKTTPKGAANLIVTSNHNEALMRWLNEYKPERDPLNALIYHELCGAVYGEAAWDKSGVTAPDPFELYARGKLEGDYKFLNSRDSHLIEGIDVSQHGHRGANGARGAINSFAQSEYKMIVGHSHSPGIKYGCYQVGTSTHLKLEYNSGLSSWINTHCIIYPNGKRTLIHIIKGKWR